MPKHPLFEGLSPKPGSRRGGSEKKSSRIFLHPLPNPINQVDVETPGTQAARMRAAHLDWKTRNENLQRQKGFGGAATTLVSAALAVLFTYAAANRPDDVIRGIEAGVALIASVISIATFAHEILERLGYLEDDNTKKRKKK